MSFAFPTRSIMLVITWSFLLFCSLETSGVACLATYSHQAKLVWQDLTGRKPKRNETRWWSKWEVYQQLLEQFEDVDGSLQIVPQLQEIMSDPQRLVDLRLQLAVTIDVGQHFVKATILLGRLWSTCVLLLRKAESCCRGLSDSTFSKGTCSRCLNCK